MKKRLIFCLLALASSLIALEESALEELECLDLAHPFYEKTGRKLVTATKRIVLNKYTDAWNPSILKIDGGYLMSFRYTPDRANQPWLSFIGIVKLNEKFDPVGEAELLDSRFGNTVPSQAEDARLFQMQNKTYLLYNDCPNEVWYNGYQRRDMYLAELSLKSGRYVLGKPVKLVNPKKYNNIIQKNWVPFVWNNLLYFSYSISPHDVMLPNLETGNVVTSFETSSYCAWRFGALRGGTPAVLVDGQYLAFFHSAEMTSSMASWGEKLWHYFMGAYTFSAEPPFEITGMTPFPIIGKGFYSHVNYNKRVIFPGGFVASGSNIYVAYGKDDWEIWIATLDKKILMESILPVITIDETLYE